MINLGHLGTKAAQAFQPKKETTAESNTVKAETGSPSEWSSLLDSKSNPGNANLVDIEDNISGVRHQKPGKVLNYLA